MLFMYVIRMNFYEEYAALLCSKQQIRLPLPDEIMSRTIKPVQHEISVLPLCECLDFSSFFACYFDILYALKDKNLNMNVHKKNPWLSNMHAKK